ncbi:PfkB family carbohydrate kinase, partial [Cronobacter sakazakii]
MVRIACVGIAVQDRIYTLEALPHEGGKYVAQQYREVGGGPAATAAVAAARLGAQVDFIGRVGDDATGTQLFAELESLGVNTSRARQITGARSSQSAILVDAAGERVIVNYPSPDLPDDAGWLDDIDFGRYDAVLSDVRWHEGATRALTLARRAGVMTLLDGDVTPQDIRSLVALSDHAAFSAPGLARLAPGLAPQDALKTTKTLTNGHVYVTLGKEGCLWLENDDTLHRQAGFTVEAVDTTGAGDVFHGALAV